MLLNHEGRDTTVINEPGPEISSADWSRLEERIQFYVATGTVQAIAFAGVCPPA